MREKVMRAARECGLDVDLERPAGVSASAEEAAASIGCDRDQIARTTVFVADGDPVLAIASATREIDPDRLCDALDCAEARPASAAEVRAATGFSCDSVAPLAHGLPVVVDAPLLEQELVWASSGDGQTLFAIAPRALAEKTAARIAPLA